MAAFAWAMMSAIAVLRFPSLTLESSTSVRPCRRMARCLSLSPDEGVANGAGAGAGAVGVGSSNELVNSSKDSNNDDIDSSPVLLTVSVCVIEPGANVEFNIRLSCMNNGGRMKFESSVNIRGVR